MTSEYRRLSLLVEGPDDKRFCTEVLLPIFYATYDHVYIWAYGEEKESLTTTIIQGIDSINTSYIFFGDIDERPCVTATKEDLTAHFPVLSWDRVVAVRPEIEAWYLAGLSESACRELGLGRVANVDSVTKEQFDSLVGGRRLHTSTMVEILRHHKVEVARQRSPSFRYFWQKHIQ